jgi:hypothetical protein
MSEQIQLKLKPGHIAVMALLVALALVDLVALEGQTIYRKYGVSFRDGNAQLLEIPIERVGEKHSLRLNSQKASLALSWSIEDPNGIEVASDNEYTRHAGHRRASFTPMIAGPYRLELELRQGTSMLMRGRRDRVNVKVVVGDHQVIGPLVESFNF